MTDEEYFRHAEKEARQLQVALAFCQMMSGLLGLTPKLICELLFDLGRSIVLLPIGLPQKCSDFCAVKAGRMFQSKAEFDEKVALFGFSKLCVLNIA